jgi:hypothetical protein
MAIREEVIRYDIPFFDARPRKTSLEPLADVLP